MCWFSWCVRCDWEDRSIRGSQLSVQTQPKKPKNTPVEKMARRLVSTAKGTPALRTTYWERQSPRAQMRPEDHALVRSGRRWGGMGLFCVVVVGDINGGQSSQSPRSFIDDGSTPYTAWHHSSQNTDIFTKTKQQRTSSSSRYAWSSPVPPVFFCTAPAPPPPRAVCRATGSAAAARACCWRLAVAVAPVSEV